jgi:RimJ/RimL family protein N-acetyltransferase
MYSPRLQQTRGATEAMYLLARYVFETLGYRRYEWKCHSGNLASRAAAERLGFQFEGLFRQHMIVKGENRDTTWFSMLDREWTERREAFEEWLNPDNFDERGCQRKPLRRRSSA